MRAPSWGLEDNVVCSQPARNLSRPDGLEDPEDSKVSRVSASEPVLLFSPAYQSHSGACFERESAFVCAQLLAFSKNLLVFKFK